MPPALSRCPPPRDRPPYSDIYGWQAARKQTGKSGAVAYMTQCDLSGGSDASVGVGSRTACTIGPGSGPGPTRPNPPVYATFWYTVHKSECLPCEASASLPSML